MNHGVRSRESGDTEEAEKSLEGARGGPFGVGSQSRSLSSSGGWLHGYVHCENSSCKVMCTSLCVNTVYKFLFLK